MKKIVLISLYSVLSTILVNYIAYATGWEVKPGITELTSPTGTEILPSQNGAGTVDYWLSLTTLKNYIYPPETMAIEYVVDGGGSAISTGTKGYLEVPYAATITRATILCDQSGSIVVDIWKDTYANYPPTVADSITASAPITISNSNKSQNSILTGWNKTINAGDVLGYNVNSAATVTRCTISLKVTK